MIIRFQKSFTDQYKKLTKFQKQLVEGALELFEENPMHESLRNHPLKEKWVSYKSIAADDDLRLHFRIVNEDIALFVAVGSHDELYK
jgi:addiction module RelE/StbE family toxin